MPTYSDMVYHLGGVPANAAMPFVVGNVYFVCSSGGNDTEYHGESKDFPLATVKEALSRCTMNDCVILMPGHAETLNDTDTFLLNKEGVIVWGLGVYDRRPTYTYGTTDSSAYLKVTGANCMIHNVRLLAGSTKSRASAVYVAAKGCWLDNIHIEDLNASSYAFLEAITLGATENEADGFKLTNSMILQYSSYSQCGINFSTLHYDIEIVNNKIYGHYATGEFCAVYSATTKALLNFTVDNNLILNLHDANDKGLGVNIVGALSAGAITRNLMGTNAATGSSDTAFLATATGSIIMCENYVTTVENKSGMLSPAVDTTA